MRWFKKSYLWLRDVMMPFGLLRENLGSLMRFEITYRLLTFFVFFPILTYMERLFLIANRTSVIAAFNVNGTMRNPFTWAVLILMAFVITVFAVFEQFAICDTIHASKWNMRRRTRDIYSTGFDLCIERLRVRNWALIPYELFVLHFGAVYDVSSITSFIQIPGYWLEEFQKRPWKNVVYHIFLLFMIWLFLRLLFSMPIMIEKDNRSFWDACGKSFRMTGGRYFIRLLVLCGVWLGIFYAMYYAGTAVIVTAWYLLKLWLRPGTAGAFLPFFTQWFEGIGILFYIVFVWVLSPLLMASFQSAYYMRKEQIGENILPYTEEPHYLKKYPLVNAGVIGLIAVVVFFSVPRRVNQLAWMLNTNAGLPLVMAHRGYSSEAPENTLPAFQKAIDSGFTAAELDVQMLADGTIIVLHDSNLKRTTGVDANVWDVSYEDIRDLDNGSFFSKEYAGTKIPTLDEVLELCKDKLYLNIEIKRTGHDDGITQKVIDVIMENDYEDNCDITSQDYSTLEEVRRIDPDILTAYTSVIGLGRIEELEAADILSIQQTFATYQNIERIHRAGKRVFVWTVNEKGTMETLVSLNVDAILTNKPGLCESVIEEYSTGFMNLMHRVEVAFSFL